MPLAVAIRNTSVLGICEDRGGDCVAVSVWLWLWLCVAVLHVQMPESSLQDYQVNKIQ